jgi:cation diffusion facilitator family transporter
MSAGGGTKAIIAALLANMGIALAKFVAFFLTGSSSMLAEGVHSVADSSNQGLLLLGGKKSRKAPTAIHPFGFGRERYFWSFVVSIILFTLGSLFAIYEGEEKIRHPHELESAAIAIGVLLIAIVLESFSFATAIRESNHIRGNASWPHFIRRAKVPELPVVLLEDFGALIGLVLALFGVGLTIVTGNPVWDGIGTLCIGLLLGAIAIVLSIEMKSLLIGEAADPVEEARIAAAIESAPSVNDLLFLRTQHFGPDELLVTAKVEFLADLTMRELADAIDAVELAIRADVPTAKYLFIEPDVRRAVATATGVEG